MLFLVFGENEPQVHYLTPRQQASLYERLALAGGSAKPRQDAFRITFGIAGAWAAIPAVQSAMTEAALELSDDQLGPHSDAVRALAAALALEHATYEWPSSQTRVSVYGVDSDDDGGDKVTQQPHPVMPSPQDAVRVS